MSAIGRFCVRRIRRSVRRSQTLIERRRAARDQERAEQRVHEIDQRRAGTRAQRIGGCHRQQDEEIQPRLHQCDEVARSRM
jgi:hypothetical protein